LRITSSIFSAWTTGNDPQLIDRFNRDRIRDYAIVPLLIGGSGGDTVQVDLGKVISRARHDGSACSSLRARGESCEGSGITLLTVHDQGKALISLIGDDATEGRVGGLQLRRSLGHGHGLLSVSQNESGVETCDIESGYYDVLLPQGPETIRCDGHRIAVGDKWSDGVKAGGRRLPRGRYPAGLRGSGNRRIGDDGSAGVSHGSLKSSLAAGLRRGRGREEKSEK
jgi:hypothetical protein